MYKKTTIIKTTVAWTLSLVVLIPLAIVILSSLKTKPEAAGMDLTWPAEFQFSNYPIAIEKSKMAQSFFNSLVFSSVSATISTVSAAMGAFVMQRNKTRLNNAIYNYIFIGLMAPINYVATILVYQGLGLMNSYAGAILLYSAMGIPFALFVYYGFIGSIPKELDEAAIIDGANQPQLFFRIIFPLLKPVTMTAFVLNFMGAWNDFISPLYLLNSQSKWPMVMSVYNFFGMYFNEWNMICVAIIMCTLPIIVLYIFTQRYIVSGLTSGSVKL